MLITWSVNSTVKIIMCLSWGQSLVLFILVFFFCLCVCVCVLVLFFWWILAVIVVNSVLMHWIITYIILTLITVCSLPSHMTLAGSTNTVSMQTLGGSTRSCIDTEGYSSLNSQHGCGCKKKTTTKKQTNKTNKQAKHCWQQHAGHKRPAPKMNQVRF